MAHAQATIGRDKYLVAIDASGHALVADEPQSNGGADKGAAPYDLLLASLGACTAITLRMYTDRKGWDLERVHVDLHYGHDGKAESIQRRLTLDGNLDNDQCARIVEIAEKTPVTLTLKRSMPIVTELASPGHTRT